MPAADPQHLPRWGLVLGSAPLFGDRCHQSAGDGQYPALLRRDLDCPKVDYVVFVWVLQQEETAAALLDGLDEKARILRITLDASDESLSRRVQKDIAAGLRTPDSLERSLAYQRFYPGQGTLHLSTDGRSPAQLADEIAGLVRNRAES